MSKGNYRQRKPQGYEWLDDVAPDSRLSARDIYKVFGFANICSLHSSVVGGHFPRPCEERGSSWKNGWEGGYETNRWHKRWKSYWLAKDIKAEIVRRLKVVEELGERHGKE